MINPYRFVRAKAARSVIRDPWVWSWHVGLKPQDMFLASYPRSGSTWLRFILFQVLAGEDPGFGNLEKRLPEIHIHRGAPPILPNGGRLIKTHEQYRSEYTRAAVLIRDVRDVFLSTFAGCTALGLAPIVSNGDMDSFLEAFVRGKALQQGSWQDHTLSWLRSPLAENGNLLVVRYEDLRQKPEENVGKLLEFFGVTPNYQAIRKAIEDNSLQQMRKKEENAKKTGERTELLGRRKALGEQTRFVRQGAVGGWREQLTETQIKFLEEYAGEAMLAAGYEPSLVAEATSV